MKLLFDENLSFKLVARLAELYPGSLHVADAGLMQTPDSEIWEFARAGGFIIVTADSYFYELATTIGPPPKVVWLRRWTHATRDGERILCGGRRSGSRNLPPTPNSRFWCSSGIERSGAAGREPEADLTGLSLPIFRVG